MKRFLLFEWWDYYPSGAINDAQGSYDTIEEVREARAKSKADNAAVLDMDRREWVEL